MLTGFIRSINEYVRFESQSTFMEFNTDSNNFNLILNCQEEEVAKVQSMPVASDKVDFAVSNNVLNLILPYAYELRFNTLVARAFGMNTALLNVIDDYNLRQARGLFRITKDEELLKQLKDKDLHTKSSFRLIKGNQYGEIDGEPVNRLRFTAPLFIEFQDFTNKTQHDIALAPVDIILELDANLVDQEDGS